MGVRPHWRKATWVLVLWCVLILVWAIAGAANNKCDVATDSDACKVGTGIGVAIIMIIGFIGFVFFSLIWLMSRPKGRMCPRCGHDVKKGLTGCKNCGFDFTASMPFNPTRPGAPLPPPPPR